MTAKIAKPCGEFVLLTGGAPAVTGRDVSFSDGLRKSGIRESDLTEPSRTGVLKQVSTGTMTIPA